MTTDARTTMIAGAARMLGERGVGATSVRELAKVSGAPLGSTYHHFPGGKDQLVEEAVGWVSARVERLLARAAEGGGALEALDAFIGSWRQLLEASDFGASCPVLAVATEDTTTTGPASAVFDRWQALIAGVLRTDGVAADRAGRLSWLILAGLEGAVVMARTQRSAEPLDAVAAEVRALVSTAVAAV